MRMPLVLSLLLVCCSALAQQQSNQTQYPTEIYLGPPPSHSRLTVNDVIQLSQASVGDDVIIKQIQKKGHRFDLSTSDILRLKDSGVSNQVIRAMVDPSSVVVSPTAPPTAAVQQKTVPPSSATPDPPNSPPVAVATVPPLTALTVAATEVRPATPPPVPPSAAAKVNDGKIRVYVTDRPITEVISMIKGGSYGSAHASGYANGSSESYSASAQQASHAGGISNDQRGGADPRTLEVSGDIGTECHISNLVVTSNPDAADYILDFRRRGGTRSTFFIFGGLTGLAMSAAVKVDHAGLYKPDGDLVYAAKARTVGGAVKEICPHFAQPR